MPPLLAPVLLLGDRLRTSARLGVLVAMLLVPTMIAVVGFVSGANHDIDFTAAEREGVAVVVPAIDALAALVQGEDADLAGLTQAVADHPRLGLDAALADVTAAADPAAEAAALQALVTAAGDSSNLILDPDLDSFYVMDSLIVQIPRLLVAALAQTSPQATGDDRVTAQAVLVGTLAGASAALASDVTTSCDTTADAGLCGELDGLLGMSEATQALADALVADMTAANGADPSATGAAVADAIATAGAALDRLLATRQAGFVSQRLGMLVATVVFVALAIWFAAGVWWRNRRDVLVARSALTALAHGDLSEREVPSNNDEMGEIGAALVEARGQMAQRDAEIAHAQAERAHQLQVTFLQQREAEKQSRERAQALVAETSTAVVAQLDAVVDQVRSVHEAATLIEDRVNGSTRATADVVNRARHADSVVGALSESLHSVAGIVKVINGIADQTKLLALNATIEAARAGEMGRGFAIVAGEVKELAAETASSTAQITQIIGTLEQDASAVSTAITEMGNGIGDVDSATTALSSVAEQQYALVADLNGTLGETIVRIQEMSQLSDRLERRRHERVPTPGLDGELEVKGRRYPVTVADLSLGGCRVIGQGLPRVAGGEKVALHGEVDGHPRVLASVVQASDKSDGTQLRLEFVDPDLPTMTAIRRVIEDRLTVVEV